MTHYRVILARRERDWAKADRLQGLAVEWDRSHAAPFLGRPVESLAWDERNAIRSLAASLNELAEVRRQNDRDDCVLAYEEALWLSERIGDRAGAAICALNLGTAYKDLETSGNLDKAERWIRKSLELRDEQDGLGRAGCYGQLGGVTYERFLEAREVGRPSEELAGHLEEAGKLYQEALRLLPQDAAAQLDVTHNQLGIIYKYAGDLDQALFHYRQSIHWATRVGDRFSIAQTCYNISILLRKAGREDDALEYAEAALRGFESVGVGAADRLGKASQLIAEIRGG